MELKQIFKNFKIDGEIKSIDFNTITVNRLLTKITIEVQKELNYLEEGQTQYLNLNSLS